MDMSSSKTYCSELEAKRFEFPKSSCARIDVRLFAETVVAIFGHEHHCDPVVARVATDRFKAPASYVCHVCSLHSLEAPR